MSPSIFLLWLVSIPLLSHSLPAPRGFPLSCGSSGEVTVGGVKFIPDEGFISVGNKTTLTSPDLLPTLSTLRYFPDTSARKYCYEFPAVKGGKYLIRTTYYYGGFDGGKEPPVFDQIVDGTLWSVVNTTADFANGLSSYYELVMPAMAKTLSVCIARNEHTNSDPFISALELMYLEGSVYNLMEGTDGTRHALSTVARSSFGYDGDIISYPDDQFNRYWQPFTDENPVVSSHSNVSSSDFYNVPPAKVFNTAITTSRGKTLRVQWPPGSLPSSNYYIALYFQDNRTPSTYSWRVFSVAINGHSFYSDLNVTARGVTVSAKQWTLSGQTEIVLTPGEDIPVGPVISAGEILQLLPLGRRTLTRDVKVMVEMARSFNNPPSDWNGDPCLPEANSWTGVTCTKDKLARIAILNLTSIGLSGSLPTSIANLSSLTDLWLGGNSLSGPIPEMGTLKELKTLHLENNQFEGSIPQSLSQLPKLQEIFLQNNNIDGKVPDALQKRTGINIQVSSGNQQPESA